MEPETRDPGQAMQRVRVGMTGLAVVLVLIALASAIHSVDQSEPETNLIAANEVAVNEVVEKAPEEPLAELGVTPSTLPAEPGNAATITKQIEAEQQKDSAKSR
ncbi:hypothetical protein [Stakelama saccharophila]|uniref:Uncharacterized protein n=1 Tax=Stakelama saccharophila TaxID=3075605 RepID=A0ABZ0B6T1_9SPHN|nr:hypothetical protein [Stakelama sp. W311]WNO53120.1 hypothetical protein RPR59_11760 [Stakelama sp. W311]